MDVLIARVDGLEKTVGKMDGRIDGLDTRLRGIETGVASLDGRVDTLSTSVVGKLPTVWQIPAAIAVTAGALVAIEGLRVAVMHWLHVG